MDPTAFDTLTRAFTTAGSRRRLLVRLVAALPLAGVLAARADGPAATAAAQRNRQQRNNRGNNNQNNNNQNNNNQNSNGGVGSGDADCGELNHACCAGNRCSDDDLACVFVLGTGDTCLQCGDLGQPCCDDNSCIQGTCDGGMCQQP
jgi:hypothetical protein